ncbi:Equilibrative nucleoside transporter 3 [Thelohanellus kitauei]|uniref:Equilibrative nucleoside transporter 3 n=1 Tax=Thelohanellus kitauei TaxID=669202 RepID=A0A0C2J4M3_THEKT|nr:Equilibrative nucleoside transporter 3 [Thelohanellus kitauei]
MFNLGDFCGRYMSLCLKYPRIGSAWMLVCTILRLIFLPLYMLCNSHKQILPNYIESDIAPIVFNYFFGFTNGHLITLQFTSPFTLPTNELKHQCSTLFVLIVNLGLTAGAFSAFVFN